MATRKLPRVLILWGVPGTGKSTFAKHLVQHHGYVHIDTDVGGAGESKAAKAWRALLNGQDTPENFVKVASYNPEPVVTEYGMSANERGIARLRRLRDAGAEPWWFDGDRAAAFKAWQDENKKARPNFVDPMWRNVVSVIDDNYAALKAFFGSNLVRTIEAGPVHVPPEDTFRTMFGNSS
jgi:hypothetical protein